MYNRILEEHDLTVFFLITFLFTWVFWVPQALISTKLLTVPQALENFLFSPYNPAAFGPLVSAFLLTYSSKGVAGLKSLLKRGIDFRFKKIWYIPIFLLFPLLTGTSLLLAILSGEPSPNLIILSDPPFILLAFIYILFLGGPFQEEWGWRGYALDRLQFKWNALFSSIILGTVWGIWHTPLFFIPGTIQSQTPIWGFMILIVCGSILFTWIYNNTGGSIFAMILFHTMNNLSFLIFPTVETELGGLYLLIINIVSVAAVVIVFGYKKLVYRS
ncbi:MAG: CPBP family intramembrane metalloprotease [Nitrososphaeria archaeon]|nr:CPBP family intramembrane metalloprotease [Nitrososphaeria archaeon]